MADLRILRAGFNQFSGPLSADLAELRSLQARARRGFALGRRVLLPLFAPPPPLPAARLTKYLSNLAVKNASFQKKPRPQLMYVEHNALSGPLPPQLALMDSLTSLAAGFNAFEGPILPELFGLTQARPRCAAACAVAEAAAATLERADPSSA
jgi:hypothetical protein